MKGNLLVCVATFCAICLPAPLARGADDSPDLATLRRQFVSYCLAENAQRGDRLLDDIEVPKNKIAEALKWTRLLNAEGSFPDMDYDPSARSAWVPYSHLTRLLSVIVYAQQSSTPDAERLKCRDAVHRGLSFWMKHDFKCPNWWYNEIGVPKITGTIALLLADDLHDDEKLFITDTILPRARVGAMTGQNRVWLAANGLMRGMLKDDSPLVEKAAKVIAEELVVADKPGVEGIQVDWSFHQHGAQLQFGNYGMAFAVEMSRWSAVLRGTKYAFPADKQGILQKYVLEGQNWIVWRGVMDISACGRQLIPHSPAQKAGVIEGVVRTLGETETDAASKAAFGQFLQRNTPRGVNDLVGNRFFYRSDYAVHRMADMMVSVKMHSPRVIGGENTNKENLAGSLLADGATFVYTDGQDYQDIFPAWDWRKIPGITAEIRDGAPQWGVEGKADKTGAFVGGVSDGRAGVACMDFARAGVSAKKSWFFCKNRVFCLGADIQAPAGATVMTTVAQCLLKGPVQITQDQQTTVLRADSATSGAITQMVHQGVRYRFFSQPTVNIMTQTRTGNWSTVFTNPSTPKADVTRPLLTAGLDHTGQANASYAYAIESASVAIEEDVILQNRPELQAIVSPKWAGAVFWKAGKLSARGLEIEVDQPCVIACDRDTGAPRITVADPTQTLKEMTIVVNGEKKGVRFPTGIQAGAGVRVP